MRKRGGRNIRIVEQALDSPSNVNRFMSSFVFMSTLSRHGRRRVSFGCIATSVITGVPRGFTRATSTSNAGDPYQAIKELASRMQQAELVRAPRPEMSPEAAEPRSKIEEKRLRTELAYEICQSYQALPTLKLPLSATCDRAQILMFLSSECSPKDDVLNKVTHHFLEKWNSETPLSTRLQANAISSLRKAATPAYEDILEYILKRDALSGLRFLVDLRVDILRALQWIRSSSKDDERFPHLEDLDAYLLRLFSLWFSPGMLGESIIGRDVVLLATCYDTSKSRSCLTQTDSDSLTSQR